MLKSILFGLLIFANTLFAGTFTKQDFLSFYKDGRKVYSDKGSFYLMEADKDSVLLEGIVTIDGVNYETSDELSYEVLSDIIVKVETKADHTLIEKYRNYMEKKNQLITENGKYRIIAVFGQRMEIHGYATIDGINFEIKEWESIPAFSKIVVEVK